MTIRCVQAMRFRQLAGGLGVKTVCEVGFNTGHSAAAILLIEGGIRFISIDVSEEPHVIKAANLLGTLFPDKFQILHMDSR